MLNPGPARAQHLIMGFVGENMLLRVHQKKLSETFIYEEHFMTLPF